MKANKAPEKIYFNRESIESIPDDDPLFNYLSIKENDDDIEDIRKDAFIEKATKWLLTNASDYCILHNSYNTKELVEDFVNAMKRD